MRKVGNVVISMVVFLMMGLTVFAAPGKMEIDNKLVDVDVLIKGDVFLINLKDYEKYFPCDIEIDKETQEITIGRQYNTGFLRVPMYQFGKYKVGEDRYYHNFSERYMDAPTTQIGDNIYIPLHILCRISGDILGHTLDGKYPSVLTGEAIEAREEKLLEMAGSWEEYEKWCADREFLGDMTSVRQVWDYSNATDSIPMLPRNPDGSVLAFKRVLPPEVDRNPENGKLTGEYKQYGDFKIPLYKGSKISWPDGGISGLWFQEEIRQPYGLVISKVKPVKSEDYDGVLEISISKKADVALALDGMREILRPHFNEAQVEKVIRKIKQCSLKSPDRGYISNVETAKFSTNIRAGGLTARGENSFARLTISLKTKK